MIILKLDATLIKGNDIEKYLEGFKKFNFDILAEKIETQEDFDKYKAYGCKYFQGYIFAKPSIIQKSSIDPAYKKIFQLVNLLDNDNSDISEIAGELEREIQLTVQLLRFMNSSYMGFKKEIKSVHQVVTLLGRKPFKQWLLLIAFSKSMANETSMAKNPILELAQNRAKIMSGLAKKINNKDYDDSEASFAGILSLIGILLNVPIDTVLGEINVSKSINNALVDKSGELGRLLELVIAIETFDIAKSDLILDELGISNEDLSSVLQASYVKA